MTPKERLDELLKEIHKEFGGQVIIEEKTDQWYWKVLSFLYSILSFGKTDFMTKFTTVIGPRIGLPKSESAMGPSSLYVTLLHERAHLRQSAKFSKNLWLGAFFHMWLYVFVFLPFGLSYFRAKYEKEGYAESIRAWIRLYGYQELTGHRKEVYKNHVVKQFVTYRYGWMWPFKKHMNKWYEETLVRIAREEGVL